MEVSALENSNVEEVAVLRICMSRMIEFCVGCSTGFYVTGAENLRKTSWSSKMRLFSVLSKRLHKGQTDRQIDRQTERQADGQTTDKETGRRTDRQTTDKETGRRRQT